MPKSSLWTDNPYIHDFLVDPHIIVQKLDKYIIGQHEIKRLLAVAILQRGMRFLMSKNVIDMDISLQKNNILMLGQTGSGKTAIIKALSEVQQIPILVYDITATTSSGYIGMKVENIIGQYILDCIEVVKDRYRNYEEMPDTQSIVEKGIQYAECGIVYIDEFDKCRRVRENSGRDINGEGVQQGLLKIFEGNTVHLSDERGPIKDIAKSFNTENLLVVAGGAFTGLAEIIKKRLNTKGGIGFGANIETSKEEYNKEVFKEVINQDLIEYGFLPELIGRITYITALDKMTEETLINILLHAKKSPIKQYQAMFEFFNIDLVFTKTALKQIAQIALNTKTGARALNSIVSKILLPIQYDIYKAKPGKLTITRQDVLKVF